MRDGTRATRKVVGLLLLVVGTAMFFWGASSSWALRDGSGPGGVASHGPAAVVRFARDFSEFLFISIGFWTAGWYLLRRKF